MWFAIKVLDAPISASQITKAAASSLRTTIGAAHVEIADGSDEDWKILSLPKTLQYLCNEAENFRLALREVVAQSGLRRRGFANS